MADGSKVNLPIVRIMSENNDGSNLVLFLSGLSGSSAQWDLVLPQLEGKSWDFAYGAPILPNVAFNGRRPTVTALAALIADEIRRLNYTSVIVVAHSVGSFVALGVCRLLPGVVKTAILINGGLTTVAKFLDKPAREMIRNPGPCLSALRLFILVGSPAPARVKRAIASSERSSKAVLGNLVSKQSLASEEQRRSMIERAGSPDSIRALWDNRHHWQQFVSYAGDISARVIFLVGDQDPMSSEIDTRSMAALLPHASVEVLKGVGHAAPIETGKAVAKVIIEAMTSE